MKSKSYIGKFGYTILKSTIEPKEFESIVKDLTLQPIVKGPFKPDESEMVTIYAYRESSTKIYIPRFFGIERYGEPILPSMMSQGLSIQCPFVNPFSKQLLRDNQIPIVTAYLDHVSSGKGGGILEAECAAGKTVMGIYIASVLGVKTLILVHKEFLMNQWIERMKTFLPSAKIGKIQGDTFDIEGKDIVIGMIQTMYRRDYDLSDFGLTIIDEVHRIGSEEFSKTLFKVVTRYMLGISATVDRKDGLTQLLYMFIGPKIYSSEKKQTDTVTVRGLTYKTTDEDFNEVEYDFRGNVKYSTMVSKLCNYGGRTRFIFQTLKDLIAENSEAQIIVLAHNICLLETLFRLITEDGFATTGYYKGGMKREQLKASEDKQIVLGSYAMASEGLDIPSLSTLVLATPKTDIIQCVGRILRVKRANPIVVDIVDVHPTFQNQWSKRKTYYRKCGYAIEIGTTIQNCMPLPGKKSKQEKEEEEDEVNETCQVDEYV